jgi:catechol 2,3-dioxygenase-like lactoylglutathione lyase family enzyme
MGDVQLNMVGLITRDMARSLAFYRRLGLEIPAEKDNEPFVLIRMPSGVSLFWDTVFADAHDPRRTVPAGGYQIMLEFFLGSEAEVDRMYDVMTTAGYHGRSAGQAKAFGPYAALVDDPDGNVVLLTAEPKVD